MTDSHRTGAFGARLLEQDETLTESEYKEYRMNLEDALTGAERKERLAGHVAVVSFAIALALMFIGGSEALGSFDPWDKNATIVSVTLGVIYCVAAVLFWISLASYFSRFRPKVKEARENIRDASILDLKREIHELRRQIEAISRGTNST